MSKSIIEVEYLINSEEMTDEEFDSQPYSTFIITEDMIKELILSRKKLKSGEVIDQLYVTRL